MNIMEVIHKTCTFVCNHQPTAPGRVLGHDQTSEKRSCSQYQGIEDGEDENTSTRKKSRVENSPSLSKRLACPFYRNDPENHQKHRSCAGPGWTSIHRVKEHILRQHALPIHCPRCLKTFNADAECKLHLRQLELCPLSDYAPPEGYNKEQEISLRIRRRGDAGREWVAIHKLLFPAVPEDLIPSPYYDDDDTQLEKLQLRESNRFQRHMELAVPRSVTRLLEQTRFEPPAAFDVPFRIWFVEIVTSAVAEAFQSYQQRRNRHAEAQGPAIPNETFNFTHQPQVPGVASSMPLLPIFTLTHEPFQPQVSVHQYGGLGYGLNQSTGVHDVLQHQNNNSRSGHEEAIDAPSLDMSFFDWNLNQDVSFHGT